MARRASGHCAPLLADFDNEAHFIANRDWPWHSIQWCMKVERATGRHLLLLLLDDQRLCVVGGRWRQPTCCILLLCRVLVIGLLGTIVILCL